MGQVLAIVNKDILQWTRRPLYFIASILLAILIISAVGNTIAGATDMPFGLYDPASVSALASKLEKSKRFHVTSYSDLNVAKQDLLNNKVVAVANVSQDPLQDAVEIITEGHNPLMEDQIAMGVLGALSGKGSSLDLPLHTASLFPVSIPLRDYVTPGLAAYLCYVLASMNLGFSWIYEWMERTYRQIILAPNGLRSAIIAKTFTVTVEASVVLWLALSITAPIIGFSLGTNFWGLIACTIISMFSFTCIGLGVACFLRTIRIYTMTVSIFGVALMFVSGIFIPVEAMPRWEQICAFKGVMLGLPAQFYRDYFVLIGWAVAGLLFSSVVLQERKAAL